MTISHCPKKKIRLENPTFIPKIVFNKSRVEKFVCNFLKEEEEKSSFLFFSSHFGSCMFSFSLSISEEIFWSVIWA